MDRMSAQTADGRVFEIRDLKVDERFMHPDYLFEEADGTLAATRRLVLFKIIPKLTGYPSFVARWDGGNRAFLRKIRYSPQHGIEVWCARTDTVSRTRHLPLDFSADVIALDGPLLPVGTPTIHISKKKM